MKRLLVLMLATGFLLGGCSEQRETDGTQDGKPTETAGPHAADDFQHSVQAVLEDADRQIDQLAGRSRARWHEVPEELEVTLAAVRRRHAALRQNAQQLKRREEAQDSALQADIRRQLSGLQRELEIAELETIPTRREFESEIRSHVEGVEVQIALIDRRLQTTAGPIQSDYRRPVSRLEHRHERLKQKLFALQTAGRDEFGDLRRQMANEVTGLKADVRQIASEVDRAADRRPES